MVDRYRNGLSERRPLPPVSDHRADIPGGPVWCHQHDRQLPPMGLP
jgi:hypothetical protein